MCCDYEGKELDVPIIFSEWTFPFNDARMQRKAYPFAELLAIDESKKISKNKEEGDDFEQVTLFVEKLDISEELEEEGQFLWQYITHYRCIQEDDT